MKIITKTILVALLIGCCAFAYSQTVGAIVQFESSSQHIILNRLSWYRDQVPVIIDNPNIDLTEARYFVVDGSRYAKIPVSFIHNFQGDPGNTFIYPEILIDGSVILYLLEKQDRFFVQNKQGVHELYQITRNDGRLQDVYKSILLNYLESCDIITSQDIAKLKFDKVHLMQLISRYNSACGSQDYTQKSTYHLELGPVLGYRQLKYEITQSNSRSQEYFRIMNLFGQLTSSDPQGGIYLSLRNARNRIGTEFTSELLYSQFRLKGYYEHPLGVGVMGFRSYTANLEMKLISLAVSGRIHFLFKDFSAFIGGGLNVNIVLNTIGEAVVHEEATYTPPYDRFVPFDTSENPSFTNGFFGETGITYKRFSVWLQAGKGFDEYFNTPTEKANRISVFLACDLLRPPG